MARKKETWIDTKWRPAIAWSYLIICVFDFLVAPIISAVFQSLMYPGMEYVAWKPNTLAEGGLYHMAMMAIVGVTAWTRAQEKMMRMNVEEEVFEEEGEIPPEEPEEEPEEPIEESFKPYKKPKRAKQAAKRKYYR